MSSQTGKRLRRYILERMARHDIATQEEVWRRAGIGRDTGQAWLRGQRIPSAAAGARLAAIFGESYFDLLRVLGSDGDELDDQTLIAAFEWAIQQVRGRTATGRPIPPHVTGAVEEAERARKGRTRSQPRPSRRSPSGG